MSGETANRCLAYVESTDHVREGPATIQALAEHLDVENHGEVDFLTPGVASETDWSFTCTISASTGAVTAAANTGGIAWITQATVGLMRTATAVTSAAIHALAPPSKPSSGHFMTIGIELAPGKWGQAATASVVSGTEESAQNIAEANSPAVSEHKIRLRDLCIKNTSGVYSIVSETDRRELVSPSKPTAWNEFSSYEHGWSAAGAPSETAWRREGHFVRLRGSITGGTSGEPAVYLPRYHTPAQAETYGVWGSTGLTKLVCEPSGAILPYSTGTVSLAGITISLT